MNNRTYIARTNTPLCPISIFSVRQQSLDIVDEIISNEDQPPSYHEIAKHEDKTIPEQLPPEYCSLFEESAQNERIKSNSSNIFDMVVLYIEKNNGYSCLKWGIIIVNLAVIAAAVATFANKHYDDTQLVAIFLLTASLIGISKTMLFFEMNTESFQSTDKRSILNFDSIINCLTIIWLLMATAYVSSWVPTMSFAKRTFFIETYYESLSSVSRCQFLSNIVIILFFIYYTICIFYHLMFMVVYCKILIEA